MTGRTHALDLVPGLADLAQRQEGVVHRAQLEDLGVTFLHVRNQIRAQRWTAIGPSVVSLTTGVLTRGQLRHAAVLQAGDEASLDGLTSLELFGLERWDPEVVDVVVPHGVVVSSLPGVKVHWSRHLDPVDRTVREGLRCTTPERATVNAASRQRSRARAAGLVLAAVQQRVTTSAGVLACLERLTKVRYVDTIREAAEDAAGGADALSEVRVTRLLRMAGLTSYRRQVVVDTADGPRPYDVAVDLPDGSLLLVEVDGPSHDDPVRRAKDLAKDAAAVALGHQVLRLPSYLLRPDQHRIVSQFAAIRAAAQRRFGSEDRVEKHRSPLPNRGG